MVAPGYRLLLILIPDRGGSALPGGPFCLGVLYQDRMDNPLPEFHLPSDPRPDLLGPADAQHLCEDDIGKDKGYLGVPTTAKNPLPFHRQYGREAAPYCS